MSLLTGGLIHSVNKKDMSNHTLTNIVWCIKCTISPIASFKIYDNTMFEIMSIFFKTLNGKKIS